MIHDFDRKIDQNSLNNLYYQTLFKAKNVQIQALPQYYNDIRKIYNYYILNPIKLTLKNR